MDVGQPVARLLACGWLAAALCGCPDEGRHPTPLAAPPDASAALSAPAKAGPLRVVSVTSRSKEALDAFNRARTLDDNNRDNEALEGYRQALALDPDFAFAEAMLGSHTPGPDGLKRLERAVSLAKGLPGPERLFIAYQLATRQADRSLRSELLQRLLKEAPDDWRVLLEVGQHAYEQRKWSVAVEAYRRSMTAVHTCAAYNNIGYAQAMQRRFDLAALALDKCIELEPKEPNPLDSLGEIQLAAGNFDAAQAAFEKALVLDPRFYSARHGLASIHFLRGEWAPGFEEMVSARAATLEVKDRFEMDVVWAWALLAGGQGDAAVGRLAALEKDALALKEAGAYDVLWARVSRSQVLHELGQNAEAEKLAVAVIAKVESAGLGGEVASALRRRATVRLALAASALGDAPATSDALNFLEAEHTRLPDDPEVSAGYHLARGEVAAARSGPAAGIEEWSQCQLAGVTEWGTEYQSKPEDVYCVFRRLAAQEAASDPAAKRTRDLLAHRFSRDPVALYVQARARAAKP